MPPLDEGCSSAPVTLPNISISEEGHPGGTVTKSRRWSMFGGGPKPPPIRPVSMFESIIILKKEQWRRGSPRGHVSELTANCKQISQERLDPADHQLINMLHRGPTDRGEDSAMTELKIWCRPRDTEERPAARRGGGAVSVHIGHIDVDRRPVTANVNIRIPLRRLGRCSPGVREQPLPDPTRYLRDYRRIRASSGS
jgi:hypothetical protein